MPMPFGAHYKQVHPTNKVRCTLEIDVLALGFNAYCCQFLCGEANFRKESIERMFLYHRFIEWINHAI